MNDDLDYVRARIPMYCGYADEPSRHDSDKRVRALLGEALSDARFRFPDGLDAPATAAYEELLMLCMFTDQAIIHRLEHAKLDEARVAELVASDRLLLELHEAVTNASSVDELSALVVRIREHFAVRHEPLGAPG